LATIVFVHYSFRMSISSCRSARRSAAREAWALVLQLSFRHRNRFAEVAAGLGLSAVQAHVLRSLDPGEPVPMRALASALSCDASNVTGLIDRLEDLGLVERRAHDRDRRVKILGLTSTGHAVREALIERLLDPPEEIARLSAAEQRTLRDLLRRGVEP
jgi:DNA-binding MarR family transcriptional regulator